MCINSLGFLIKGHMVQRNMVKWATLVGGGRLG